MLDDELRTLCAKYVLVYTYRGMEDVSGVKWTLIRRFISGHQQVNLREAIKLAAVCGYDLQLVRPVAKS